MSKVTRTNAIIHTPTANDLSDYVGCAVVYVNDATLGYSAYLWEPGVGKEPNAVILHADNESVSLPCSTAVWLERCWSS